MSSDSRRVAVEDQRLTPEANRLLTAEVREALGRDHVDGAGGPVREVRTSSPRRSLLRRSRLVFGLGLGVALVLGAILTLVTGSWWWLGLAVLVHAVATGAITFLVLQLTTNTEHPDPSVVDDLEREGVEDPEQVVTDVVRAYTGDRGAPGDQSTALTPSSDSAA